MSNYNLIYHLSVNQFNLRLINLRQDKTKFNLEITPTEARLTVNMGRHTNYYACDLVEGKIPPYVDYGNMTKCFFKNIHIITEGYGRNVVSSPTFGQPDKVKIHWDYIDPGNYSYIDPQRRCKWLNCWSYDCNSAYPYAMLKDMPDTRAKPRYFSRVGEHEIGFYKNGSATTVVGRIADIVFPLMESPMKSYVNKYYKLKSESQGEEKAKWKKWLVIPAGQLQRKNIFLRLAVLHYAKEYIMQYIDDDTVYCNVDSIVSTKPRNDIPLGKELGLFKQEHANEPFKYKDVGIYQWSDQCHYCGVPLHTIKDIEDLSNVININKYFYNEKKGLIDHV